jgi:PAS domain S-box-containing protein
VNRSLPRLLLLWYALALLLLPVNAAILATSVRTIRANEAAVVQTLDVLNTLEVVFSTLIDAESGQRGFLITGEDSYLEPYGAARASITGQLVRLGSLLADNPEQLARFRELERRVGDRIATLEEVIALRRSAGFAAAQAVVRQGRGKQQMEAAREVVAAMEAEERQLLAARARASEAGLRNTITIFALAAAVNLISLLLIAVFARRDMRHREQAAAELREQREWFAVTLASIGDAVIATDSGGRVRFMNAAAEALTSWRNADAIGRPSDEVFRIVNEATRDTVESPVARVLRENVVVGLANHTLLLGADGVERPIDDSGAPIRTQSDEVLGVVLVFRDVSERRRYEQGLREALATRDQFFSIAAHELRTPLTSLLGNAELLRRRLLREDRLSERDQRALRVIVEQGRRLTQLIAALLDLSRLERGQFALELQPLELGELARRIVEETLPSLDRHEVALNLCEEPLPVRADALRLEQVLQNLLQNAVKYSPDGGQITVTLERRDGRAVVAIADHGIGIPAAAQDGLFQRFYRAVGEHSHISGLGVGLYVVKEIVDRHGGEVWVESAEGAGSTFFVALPLAAEEHNHGNP